LQQERYDHALLHLTEFEDRLQKDELLDKPKLEAALEDFSSS
jgi:hypothetical protein